MEVRKWTQTINFNPCNPVDCIIYSDDDYTGADNFNPCNPVDCIVFRIKKIWIKKWLFQSMQSGRLHQQQMDDCNLFMQSFHAIHTVLCHGCKSNNNFLFDKSN